MAANRPCRSGSGRVSVYRRQGIQVVSEDYRQQTAGNTGRSSNQRALPVPMTAETTKRQAAYR